MNWTLEDVIEFVEACYDRDTILDVLMGYSAHWFPARMVLIVGRGWVQLFATAAFELPANLPKDARRATVSDDALAVSEPSCTGLADEVGLGTLFEQLELGAPLVRTVGIQIGNRVAIVLVGTVHNRGTDTGSLERAAEVAGHQLEAVIRMAKSNELPPEDERIPPFPTARASRPPGSASARPDGRSTQRIENLEEARHEYERELSTPRLVLKTPVVAPPEEESTPEAAPSATSFGLPSFKLPRPGQPVAAAESEGEDDESPSTEIGTPLAQSFQEDDQLAEESEPAILLDERASGVDVIAPMDVSSEPNSTMLGGMSVTVPPSAADLSEVSAATTVGRPVAPQRDPSRTQLGGIGAQMELINDAVRAAIAASSAPAAKPADPPAKPSDPPAKPADPPASPSASTSSSPTWSEPKSPGAVPSAMILKRAPKRKRAPAESASASPDKSPDKDDEDRPAPAPSAPSASKSTPKKDEAFDEWIDAFAEEAKNFAADNGDAALNFSLSEASEDPGSIPPETLDRLLEAGPDVVDMQEEFILLDSRDRERAYAAADRIAAMGEKALGVLEVMFPGRIFLDRYQYTGEMPPVDQHGPLLHALVRMGDASVNVVRRHFEAASNEARFYAVYLLTMFDAEPLLSELFDRLFDRDQQVRTVAATVALQYRASKSFETAIGDPLRAALAVDDDVHVITAAGLLARLRDVRAVEALIDAMDAAKSPRVKIAVLHALTDVTLHTWSSPYEWRHWWKSAQNETREDWLVAALDNPSAEMRQQAHEELGRIPGLELNYHPDQPAKLRKRAQEELRKWLAQKGG